MRSAWINPRAYMYSRARLVEFFHQSRLDTAFILEPRWHGATMAGFGETVRALKDLGVKCHVWVWCLEFIRGGGGLSADGRACFAADIAALVDRFGLDGAHLDGIRENKYDTATTSGPYAHLPRIDEARTAIVTETVADVRSALSCTLSAAVQKASYRGDFSGGPYPRDGEPIFWPAGTPFYRQTQQDPLRWLDRELVDFIVIMNYEAELENWHIETSYWFGVADPSRVVMGIGWAGDGRGEYLLTPVDVKARIDSLDRFSGFAVFEALQNGFSDLIEQELEQTLAPYSISALELELREIESKLRIQSDCTKVLADRVAQLIMEVK